ncbi:hypothetical protein BBC0122_007870 [Bartonella choladocola]|uniref:Uncharacterized protein n=1 Tax=Bartonella choladocola TaxID=2750995 RepID=A0A1U9MG45_9HYPH|nr:hypothetical protein BBC0122_007870 [Bartonella choladocola]
MVVIFGNSSSKCQLFSNRSNIISQQSDAHSGIVYLVLLLLGGEQIKAQHALILDEANAKSEEKNTR